MSLYHPTQRWLSHRLELGSGVTLSRDKFIPLRSCHGPVSNLQREIFVNSVCFVNVIFMLKCVYPSAIAKIFAKMYIYFKKKI